MTETITYDITGQVGEIEFRKYSRMVLASVKDTGDDSGFNLLFAYISGTNRTRIKIPMTAPVITSEQVPMTTPVISDELSMSFVLPMGKEKDEMPDPLDSRVQITAIPPREIAVIRFRGYAGQKDIKDVKSRLLDGLKKSRDHNPGPAFSDAVQCTLDSRVPAMNKVGIGITR